LEIRVGGRGGRGQGGEMAQTMYAHINKFLKKIKDLLTWKTEVGK
jgi:hypothetical protein